MKKHVPFNLGLKPQEIVFQESLFAIYPTKCTANIVNTVIGSNENRKHFISKLILNVEHIFPSFSCKNAESYRSSKTFSESP